MEYFGDEFISMGSWPPRSPDHTSSYFFLGYSEVTCVPNSQRSIQQRLLKVDIENAIGCIPAESLICVCRNTVWRGDVFVRKSGEQLHHIL
jgi:hypothetical protein